MKKILAIITLGALLLVATIPLMGGSDQDATAIEETIREGARLSVYSFSYPTESGCIADLSQEELQSIYNQKIANLEQYYTGQTLSLYKTHCENFYLKGYNEGSAVDYTYDVGVNNVQLSNLDVNEDGTTATVTGEYEKWSKNIQGSDSGMEVYPIISKYSVDYILKKEAGQWKIEQTLGMRQLGDETNKADSALRSSDNTDPVFYDTFKEAASAAEELDLTN